MKSKSIKNLKYSKSNIPKLAGYDRIKKGFKKINLKKTRNPLSSFTLYEKNRTKVIANGLNIIRKFYFIKAKKL